MEKILSLKAEFMKATDWEQSFLLLDQICDALIENKENADQMLEAPDAAFIEKVGTIDSVCEKFHARTVIADTSPRESLSQYPWLLYDYYKSEYEFFKASIGDAPFNKIACFGHGAIPALAMVMLEDRPDLQIDMFDIDPDVSQLAKDLLEKISPQAQVSFYQSDIQTHNSDTTYDAAIVTNAPLPYFMQRDKTLNAEAVFIRSSTPQGNFIYPRIAPEDLTPQGYRVTAHHQDRMYGIHEWIVAQRAP